uniref:Uncharacterized protein n=1 Tax=Anguilla anguilla TaxID=7936 RepID=A0A0E9TEZ5_ANGAN
MLQKNLLPSLYTNDYSIENVFKNDVNMKLRKLLK